MNKQGKIFAAVLAAVILFSIGGLIAAVRGNNGQDETTTAASQPETSTTEQKTQTTRTVTTQTGTAPMTEETTSKPAKEDETTQPGTQKPTTAAHTNTGGYYYNYPGINPAPAEINPDKWYLLLVNIHYYLPKNYADTIELVTVIKGYSQKLDARAAPHYVDMYNAAKKAGHSLTPNSGYRSIGTQKSLFEQKIKEYTGKGNDYSTAVMNAAKSRQPPGCSEHNAGLAMDLIQISTAFANTPEFKWLSENAANYGFILRYPEDKQKITGVKFEPWHWRYVGVDAALAMKASGQCLEEYLHKG